MYKIHNTEFKQLKEDFTEWLEIAFDSDTAKCYYSEGILNKEAETTFEYPVNCITVKVSAHASIETGVVFKAFFDDLEIIDDENNEFARHQINEQQTNELNNLLNYHLV